MCKKICCSRNIFVVVQYFRLFFISFFQLLMLIIRLRWSKPYIGSTLNNQPLIHIYIHIYTIGSLVERFFLLFGAKLLRLDGIITEFFLTDYYWKISFFSIFLLTLVKYLHQVLISCVYNCYIFFIFGIVWSIKQKNLKIWQKVSKKWTKIL